MDELAGELAAQLAQIVAEPEALLAKLAEAARRGWPDPVIGYLAAAARRAGCTWDQLGASLGISGQVASKRLSAWEERFADQVGHPLGNLPVPLSSFVGRVSERAEVARLISGCRLLTLSGPPGVGKTRLAIEVATSVAAAYAGGAWWVDLSSLDAEADVSTAVARALSVVEQPGRSIVQVLGSRLGVQRILLVLDNCEHVSGSVAALLSELLRACPRLSALATSRHVIGVPGETVWSVPTLSLPGEAPPAEAVGGLAGLAGRAGYSDSVDLFCQRAAAVKPGFTSNPEIAGAVGDICRRLDGLPLAIELAASRMGVLSAAEIAGRLDGHLSLLVGGASKGIHHQTLAEAIGWSHALLSGPEQSLFRRLSVFAGDFGLDAIEAVCTEYPLRPAGVLELVSGLVAKSLLYAKTYGPEARYRMLETIRVYASERLTEAGEQVAIHALHARWCTDLAEEAEPELYGGGQPAWLSRLESDYENLQAALSWLQGRGEVEMGQRLAGALTMFWRVHSRFAEGRHWLDVFVAAGAGLPCVRAKAVWGDGFLTSMIGERDLALTLLEEAMALYEAQADNQGCARCFMIMADTEVIPTVVIELAERSITLARELDDTWCLVHAMVEAGRARVSMGEQVRGMAMLEEAIAIARVARSPDDLRFGLAVLGGVTMVVGDYKRAQPLLEEGLDLNKDLGDLYGAAMSLVQLARLSLGAGNWDRARQLLAEGITLSTQCGNPAVIARANCVMGRLAQVEDAFETANRHFSQALSVAGLESMEQAWAIEGIGEVALAMGDVAGARLHFESVLRGRANRARAPLMARAMDRLAELAHSEGGREEAASLYRRSLVLRVESGDRAEVPDSLEALATVAVKSGHLQRGARLLGAAAALRGSGGYARWPRVELAYEVQVDELRTRLGAPRFENARAAGAGLSPEKAVEAALGTRSPERAATRTAGLTAAELEVACLAAQGLTNPEIGERLLISRRTARAHLSATFAKLGISSRKELAGRLGWPDLSAPDI